VRKKGANDVVEDNVAGFSFVSVLNVIVKISPLYFKEKPADGFTAI